MSAATCCMCGHQWETGQDGSHSCAEILKRRLEASEAALDAARREVELAHYEKGQLLAGYEAARKDGERLDWLEREAHTVTCEGDYFCVVRGEDGRQFTDPDYRAAIDAAMAGKAGEG